MDTIKLKPKINDGQLSRYLIGYLIRSMSHQIRTPLSIVSNELSCIKSTSLVEGCDLAIKKCQQISAILSKTAQLSATTNIEDEFNLSDLDQFSDKEEIKVAACERDIKILFLLLSEILDTPSYSVIIQQEDAAIKITSNATNNIGVSQKYSLLTDYYCATLQSDLIEPPLIDALIVSLKGETIVSPISETQLEINLILPLRK